ncbi:hypothetical protein LTS15_007436 [Exophiala xenobiotica]|nr:hypothetical protein LTS15_007436 [Exophiala xenobiotica]
MANPLDEEAESWRFQTKELWLLYENDARRANTWQEQNKILIQHLHQHQDRLSPYPWCPSEAWLVSWAIKNGDPPMQVFLHWSLLEAEARGGDVTIKMLEEHLKVWANLFESPRASHSREAVVDEDTPLFCEQQHTLYWEWTCVQWKKLWQQHLLSIDAMEIDSMGEVPFIYSQGVKLDSMGEVPFIYSQGVKPSFKYHPRAEAAPNYASRCRGGMAKQDHPTHSKHSKPFKHLKKPAHVKKPKQRNHASRPKNFVHPRLERFKLHLLGKRKRRGRA